MKIKFLGTAAAEGYPALFCNCENCMKAKKLGGKNIRTRSQSIIDGQLLIDFPADTYLHYLTHGFDLPMVKNCIITHGHSDHFYEEDVIMRAPVYSLLEDNVPLNFYGPKDVYKRLVDTIKLNEIKDTHVVAHLVEHYKTYDVGGYQVTPLPAAHAGYVKNEDNGDKKFKYYPVTYVIEKDGKSMLYHHDSSYYDDDYTIEFLKNRKKPFDLVTFDCNNGLNEETFRGHLGYAQCVKYVEFFKQNGLATDKTIFVVNHFSHNGKGTVYDELKPVAEKDGFIASYDGLEIEF